MNEHALDVLEFERVLERVAARAASELGRVRVLSLRPLSNRDDVARELARVGAVIRFQAERPEWGLGRVPDVGGPLGRMGTEGAVLEPSELHAVGQVLVTSRRLRVELHSRDGSWPELESILDSLVVMRELEDAIERSVDSEGRVLDTASTELKRVRSQLRGAHAKIVRKLEAYLSTLPERYVVPDASVTIRDGRYVIPVRREGRREVGGIVHDESQTGATLYIEPPTSLELMNRLRDLEREEARETRRVLGDLTDSLRPDHHAVVGALHALADFDSLSARARAARAWDGRLPTLGELGDAALSIRGGRHPLLVEGSTDVVAFDLDLAADERALVVSGPNTGGKSVLLKAVGLISTLAQSGVVPPVAGAPGSRSFRRSSPISETSSRSYRACRPSQRI